MVACTKNNASLTVYTVHYTVQCTIYSVEYTQTGTVYSVQCTLYSTPRLVDCVPDFSLTESKKQILGCGPITLQIFCTTLYNV